MDSYGTAVPADGYLGTSTTGAVSVIDTADPSAAVGSIPVGLHPTAMYRAATRCSSPTRTVTPSRSSTRRHESGRADDRDQAVAVVDGGVRARQHRVTHDGHLLVTLGRANAVAVYRYDGTPQDPVSYIGLLPTDYYPADVATAGDQIVVTNTRGIDARGPAITTYKGRGNGSGQRPRHTQHHRVSDALHAAERPGHRARHGDGLCAERLGQQRRPGGRRRQARRHARSRRGSVTRRRSSTSS